MLQIIAVLTERTQQPSQKPSFDRHRDRCQRKEHKQRPTRQVKPLERKEKCQQNTENDGVAPQQQAELLQKDFWRGTNRTVPSDRTAARTAAKRIAPSSDNTTRQYARAAVEQRKANKICKDHAGEKNQHVSQSVDLIECSLIFFDSTSVPPII